MRVYADIRQQVDIDPLDVIKNLKESVVGRSGWVQQDKDKKWYIMTEKSAGCHSYSDEVREITTEELEYYNALKTIENYLKKEKK